jgi:hypothetical protein
MVYNANGAMPNVDSCGNVPSGSETYSEFYFATDVPAIGHSSTFILPLSSFTKSFLHWEALLSSHQMVIFEVIMRQNNRFYKLKAQ